MCCIPHKHTVDAAYEAMGKRTFLPMGVMAGCHLLVLVGFTGLYTKIAPRERKDSEGQITGCKTERDPEDSDSANESTSLAKETNQLIIE